jgi:hypothetical protein
VQKIREQKNNRPAVKDMIQKTERAGNVRAAPTRLEHQHFPHEPQNVPPAFARRDEQFHLIREQQQRDLIAILGGGHRERGGDLGGELALGAAGRAEAGRRGHVHGEDGGEFALLAEAFHERAAEAVRHIPVNGAHIVAGHVFAEIFEIHAAPLEAAQIRAAHRVVHEAVRADFHAADGLEQFSERHRLINESPM